ncbi:MAG: sulfatase [Fuerstiella sp.]|nr:sulfatase [Fuerstiella sp.]MCP4853296.1 sulfatase [Fuerstiella sp.]
MTSAFDLICELSWPIGMPAYQVKTCLSRPRIGVKRYRMRLIAIIALCLCFGQQGNGADRPNVLFIIADDLRDELGCYGAPHIRSPNIDRLAASGTLFTRAYCQYAVCGPSRSSMLTGCYSGTTRAFNNRTHFRNANPRLVTLPQHFKNHGYRTAAIGKVLHDSQKDPLSWTDGHVFEQGLNYASPQYRDRRALIDGFHEENGQLPLFEGPDVADDAYRDGVYANRAVASLEKYARGEQPFFLMVGFHKPHTPFNAPSRYWDLYSQADIDLAANQFPPKDAPAFAVAGARYVRSFKDIPTEGRLPGDLQRQIKHAYFACISYIDAQVGKLMHSLEANGQAENTIVVFTSDHGYQLGEHDLWCKHTNFETSTRVPLIIADPRMKQHGRRTSVMTELIDLTPTLIELVGLPELNSADGDSVAAVLDDLSAAENLPTTARSRYHKGGNTGISIRTEHFRYTEWRSSKTKMLVARELYDHNADPNENSNVAELTDYAATVRRLERFVAP